MWMNHHTLQNGIMNTQAANLHRVLNSWQTYSIRSITCRGLDAVDCLFDPWTSIGHKVEWLGLAVLRFWLAPGLGSGGRAQVAGRCSSSATSCGCPAPCSASGGVLLCGHVHSSLHHIHTSHFIHSFSTCLKVVKVHSCKKHKAQVLMSDVT